MPHEPARTSPDLQRWLVAMLGDRATFRPGQREAIEAVLKPDARAQQLRNIHAGIDCEGAPMPGPVILVDDIVDSRWTLTVGGHLLRTHGSGPVHPFAFAQASTRVDG